MAHHFPHGLYMFLRVRKNNERGVLKDFRVTFKSFFCFPFNKIFLHKVFGLVIWKTIRIP